MHIIIRQLGGNNGFLGYTSLISSRIINSAALKSAITPSFNGLTVRMLSWVFSCIINAFFPTASTFFGLLRSNATMLGSFTTTSSLCMISVFAVPRSIAISCVNQLKSPILYYWIKCVQSWRKYSEISKLILPGKIYLNQHSNHCHSKHPLHLNISQAVSELVLLLAFHLLNDNPLLLLSQLHFSCGLFSTMHRHEFW